jgi:hypothetical protein
MKESTTANHSPLMYVSQSSVQHIAANMQSHFSTKQQKFIENHIEEAAAPQIVKEKKIKKVDYEDIVEDRDGKELEGVKEDKVEEKTLSKEGKRTNSRVHKRYPYLSIMEKIRFHIRPPLNMPKATCKILTETSSIMGKFDALEHDTVVVRTQQSPFKEELKLKEIKDIQIITLH